MGEAALRDPIDPATQNLTPARSNGMIPEPKQGRKVLTGCLTAIRSQTQGAVGTDP